MQLAESWLPVAKHLGFESEKDMLYALYVEQGMSITALVKKLGYARNSIRQRLMLYGIESRARGGDNSSGKTKLAHVSDAALLVLKAGDIVPDKNGLPFLVLQSTLKHERDRRIECISQQLAQFNTSTDTPDEDTSKCASPPGQLSTQSTSSGTSKEDSPETSSS